MRSCSADHLGRITTVVFEVGGAHIQLESAFHRPSPGDAVLQDLDPHPQVAQRIERRQVTAEAVVLFAVDFGH